jgi:hypothetical protein
MTITSIRPAVRWLIAAVCVLASVSALHTREALAANPALSSSSSAAAGGVGAGQDGSTTPAKPDASATLEQCLTALTQAERTATFAGEMTSIPGTARMQISIGLLERVPPEIGYRTVNAPGLDSWRGSAPGVKTYDYIKQVTDLAAPAFYRGVVRFRWLNAKGHQIKAEELRTPRCEQPAAPAPAAPTTTETANTPSASTPSG